MVIIKMPKQDTNYQDGKIYAIRSYQTDSVYYGSTTQTLTERLSLHKSDYKRYLNGNFHFITSFEILKYDDCYIELVEEYPCESKNELEKREGAVIKANNDAVNKV